MPTTLKYAGPCPDHVRHYHACNHCKALRERKRARVRSVEPRYQIYSGLHWPAPDFSCGDCPAWGEFLDREKKTPGGGSPSGRLGT
jgi:hypothetical protein